jgi:hypothetical protein
MVEIKFESYFASVDFASTGLGNLDDHRILENAQEVKFVATVGQAMTLRREWATLAHVPYQIQLWRPGTCNLH